MRARYTAISIGVVMAMIAVACTSAGEGEGDGASCALVVEFRGKNYEGLGVKVVPQEGERLGSALLPACDEDDEPSEDEHIEVASLPGVSSNRAIVWRGRNDMVLVRKGERDHLPLGVAQLLAPPNCDPKDTPISLYGPWLGIFGPNERTEVDLLAPYDVDLLVQRASAPRYQGAFLTVRVPKSLGRPLSRRDARSSLWEGGNIEVVTTCRTRGYVAERVRAFPPS